MSSPRPGRRANALRLAVLALLGGLLLAGCSMSDETPDVPPSSQSAPPSTGVRGEPPGPTQTPSTDAMPPDQGTGTRSTAAAPGGGDGDGEAGEDQSVGTGAAPTAGVTTLPPVPAGREAVFGDGLVASVSGYAPVSIKARGAGEISGSGVAVSLTLRNDSREPLELSGVAVTATYEGGTPAVPSAGDPAAPVSGKLRPGRTAKGTYVFAVPRAAAESLVVDVGFSGSRAVAVIRR